MSHSDYTLTHRLTPRECDVATLLVQRLSRREIAAQLGIQEASVGNYITPIYAKLQVANRADLIDLVERATVRGLEVLGAVMLKEDEWVR